MMYRPIASASSLVSRTVPFRCATPAIHRHHSSSSTSPAFVPHSNTSADTQIPYGVPSLASSAYLPSLPASSSSASPSTSSSSSDRSQDRVASTETPRSLTEKERRLLEEIVRVDQAGELGANYIYAGQLAVLRRTGDHRVAKLVQEMWDGEKKHIATFDKLVTQHQVRPTLLYPLWKVAGFALGAGTALMGKRAAMACTEAVETAIGEHYDAQLKSLSDPKKFTSSHPSIALLRDVLKEFRDDELEHLDTALKNEAQLAPAHALLSAIIAQGCRIAIATTAKV